MRHAQCARTDGGRPVLVAYDKAMSVTIASPGAATRTHQCGNVHSAALSRCGGAVATVEYHSGDMHVVGMGVDECADGAHTHALRTDTRCIHRVSCRRGRLRALALSDDCRTVVLGHDSAHHVHVVRLHAERWAVEADGVHELPEGIAGTRTGVCVCARRALGAPGMQARRRGRRPAHRRDARPCSLA